MKRQFFFRFALALLVIMGSAASFAQEEIFVTNASGNSVTVYSRTGSGNLAPLRTLVGAATGLASPRGVAVDLVNDELYVVNSLSTALSVTVYSRTASGNTAPLRTLSGPLTAFTDPWGLSVDVVNNELAVVSRAGFSVRFFARTASGNVAPLRTISGIATGLSNPTGIAIDVVNNELVVANNGNSLTVYSRTANGNAVPLRTISGAATGFNNGPIGVAVDTVNNELVVTNPFFGPSFLPSILVFGRTANGNVAPLRTIVGAATGLTSPIGVAVDTVNNELLVASSGNTSVRVYSGTATGNAAPSRALVGAATQLNNPAFLVITTGTPITAPSLINLSTRGQVQTGDNVMIGGFIIGGASSKTVLIRAVGPNLANFGVPGVLADPTLQLFSGQTVIASNDDWGSNANATAILDTGLAPVSPLESAILATLAPGAYTAIVSGVGGGTGVGIVEIFEIDNPSATLINLSTRGRVQTGDNVMIGGFIIQGTTPQTVLIRAVGPNLANFGVPGVLADPTLQLFSGQTVIASNDDWQNASNAAAIQATGLAPANSLESAILITLAPGAYTAIVSGVGGGTGVGIVEVFAQ